MVKKSRMSRYSLLLALLALPAILFMTGCDDEYTPTGTKPAISSAWTVYNTDVDATQFRAVSFATADKGLFVGQNGAMLLTSDGGTSWQQVTRSADGTLWDAKFVGNTAVVVGDGAAVIRSLDGGVHWNTPTFSLGVENLYALDFKGTDFTWAVGSAGVIILSENHGWDWTRDLPIMRTDTIIDTLVINPDSTIIDTTISTNKVPIGSTGSFDDLHGVDFISEGTGIVVGENGKIAYTTDTAQTWNDPTTNPATATLNDVVMLSATNAIAVGDGGTLLRTTNGGADWNIVASGISSDLNSVEFSGTTGWIVGSDGLIMRSTDGGATWGLQASGTHLDIWDASFTSATNGWFAGDFMISKTSNGGASWTAQTTSSMDLPTLEAIDFFDANHGWAVGHAGTIVSTSDGGANWLLLQGRDDYWLNDVQFVSATEGWTVGGHGVPPYSALIQHTTDGGLTWESQTNWSGVIDTFHCSTTDTSWVHAIQMLDAATGFAVGGNWTSGSGGLFLKTTNGGALWAAISTLSDTLVTGVSPDDECHPGQTADTLVVNRSNKFLGLSFVDANTGWLVGIQGMILKTTDGGTSWEHQNTKWACMEVDDSLRCIDSAIVSGGYNLYDLTDVEFVNASTGWAVGTVDYFGDNVILVTSDGGATWTRQSAGTGIDFTDVSFVDATHGWVTGTGGIAYTTSNGGATWNQIVTNAGDLLGVDPLTSTAVWVVGEDGLLIKTNSGGL